ncbi:hypothetical protein E2C01_074166 [Portunus trituberculatus]|uniref:Uncharacterized protein n=1 Tax=Portunus trituberculatus TaxID=210409 RepID=A0A5B7I509_PORTR|nr:hypothetical protein [Portunus trituberculatus]
MAFGGSVPPLLLETGGVLTPSPKRQAWSGRGCTNQKADRRAGKGFRRGGWVGGVMGGEEARNAWVGGGREKGKERGRFSVILRAYAFPSVL